MKDFYEGTINEYLILVGDKQFLLNKTFFEVTITIELPDQQIENQNLKTLAGDGILISVDMVYDEESHNSYQLKNLISLVQNCRKEMKLNPWNCITVKYCSETNNAAFEKLLSDGEVEIVKKMGTNFVKQDLLENYKVFEFTEFNKKENMEILVCVEKIDA